jgi:hypothetical protein
MNGSKFPLMSQSYRVLFDAVIFPMKGYKTVFVSSIGIFQFLFHSTASVSNAEMRQKLVAFDLVECVGA